MTVNWRIYGSSTVACSLDKAEFPGFFRNIIVGPNEAAVIIRDGKIEQAITGTRRSTSGLWDNFKKLWGRSSDLHVVLVDTSPIELAFYVGSSSRRENGAETGQISESREDAYLTIESRSRRRIDTADLTIMALTRDGQNISAEINVTLRLKADDAPLLTGLLRGRHAIADWDIAALVRDELLAKALVPLIGQHTGSEIRGNQEIMSEISQLSEITLRNKFDLYGLELINMYVNWGLTEEDELVIAEGCKDREARAIEFDHTRNVRDKERELVLERQRVTNLQELSHLEASGDVDLQEIILAGEISRDNLVDGKRINQASVNVQVKELELDIQQKESLLRVETVKADADARFAIEQRQALFDQELKNMESDRSQRTMTEESQRDIAEMTELTRLQIERQNAKTQNELQSSRQTSESDQATLRARLDASMSRNQEEQRTLRELMSSAGSADPSVLREMLKQGTNREIIEGSDAKMESHSSAQRAPEGPEAEDNKPDPQVQENPVDSKKVTHNTTDNDQNAGITGTRCTACSMPIQDGWKVCPSCGKAVNARCQNCSTEIQVGWNNCPVCGLGTAR